MQMRADSSIEGLKDSNSLTLLVDKYDACNTPSLSLDRIYDRSGYGQLCAAQDIDQHREVS